MRKFLIALIVASTSAYGSVVVMTDPSLIKTTDIVNWGQLVDQGPVQSFYVQSTKYDVFQGTVDNGNGSIKVAGTDAPSGNGIAVGDDLLATDGNGPVTFYLSPVYGVDAYIQGGGGQFTARIQAFSGLSSVLDMAVTSDTAGDPLYLGVSDTSQEITKVVYSLTSVVNGFSTGDFVMDSLMIQNQIYVAPPPPLPPLLQPVVNPLQGQGEAPEPGTVGLFGSALVTFALMLKKRSARV